MLGLKRSVLSKISQNLHLCKNAYVSDIYQEFCTRKLCQLLISQPKGPVFINSIVKLVIIFAYQSLTVHFSKYVVYNYGESAEQKEQSLIQFNVRTKHQGKVGTL